MAEQPKHDQTLTRTAVAVIAGALAMLFDTTIVSVALRTLAEDLHASVATIQWVSTAFLLALGVTIPLVSWAQSRLGGKRLWILAQSVFLIASVLCGLAWNVESLIAFRALQGVGGGIMLPLMMTLVVRAAQGRSLGRVMSTMSLPAVIGPILGPVVGGLILNSLDWRWMFWINIPLCLIGIVTAALLLPADEPARRVRLDVAGLLLVSPAVVGLLFGLSNAGRDGGFARADVLIPLLAGAALLAAFALWAVRKKDDALIDVRLLRHRPLATASTLMFLSGFALYGAMLLLPLYWQEVRGREVLEAGLLLAPQGIGSLLSRSIAGRLVDRIGARAVSVAGFLVVTVATVPFAFAGTNTNQWLLMAALVVRGAGLGAATIPPMTVAFMGIERPDVPHASVITRIATQVGGSFGVAVLGVILHATTTGARSGADLAAGFDRAFWWAVGLAAAGATLSLMLPARQPAVPAPATAKEPVAA
ncbi:MDR family MFS transporter [Actinoplanes sp. NPDC089786]|uniref:MDR family MFS transporter n=1 Tax=Actinoplanes sp. NPDC089786 TaxID=3155185 RepID=UPI00343D3F18